MTIPKVEVILFNYLIKQRELEERAPSLLEDKLHANASSAGACARQVGFRVAGTEASNPITGDALFNFSIGDAIHDQIQTALCEVLKAEKEVSGVIEDFISCRADLKYTTDEGKVVCSEIKSISDFGFELATGLKLRSNGRWSAKNNPKVSSKPAEGPKPEHLLQVGISAISLNADYLQIIYARKTAAKEEPIIAEWRFRLTEFDEVLTKEIERLRSIVKTVANGQLPAREYQGELIWDPSKVKFPCGYCSWLSICSKFDTGIVPLTKNEQSHL